MDIIKSTIFGMTELAVDEINDNIRLGLQVDTLEFAIEYGEFEL